MNQKSKKLPGRSAYWLKIWNQHSVAFDSPNQQVGRFKTDRYPENYIDELAAYLVKKASIKADSIVLDLCCGNGLLSNALAKHCKKLYAADISPEMIRQAQKIFKSSNTEFFVSEATTVHETIKEPVDVAICYFSFQYFESKQHAKALISSVQQCLKPGGCFYIGDIPDKNRRTLFYKGFLANLRYHLKKWLGKDDMGRFWSESELKELAASAGMQGQLISQPETQPHSYYRFDYKLTKN
jgi:ubiquinone/menaquinone biosynthesis C-methylase UbiE